jgi:hypothetical protein
MSVSCGTVGSSSDPPQGSQGTVDRPACTGCAPLLTAQQVAVVRQTFPDFQPDEFSPGTSPSASTLVPANFVPAEFFGPPNPASAERTPQLNISVLTNGYDAALYPAQVGPAGTYFTGALTAQQFTLGTIYRSPLDLLQQRMGLPQTHDAPTVAINLSDGRVDLSKIDQDMIFIRDQESQVLPAIANVNPANAKIVIEPTIFYAYGTNDGDIWVGGLTSQQPDGSYVIQLARFYITFDSQGHIIISNWEDFLVDEATNFYVLSIGRSDLASLTRPTQNPLR